MTVGSNSVLRVDREISVWYLSLTMKLWEQAQNRVSWQVCISLDVIESKPVSDVWKFYMLHDQRKAVCNTVFVRKNLHI